MNNYIKVFLIVLTGSVVLSCLGTLFYKRELHYDINESLKHDNVLPVLIVGSGVAGLSASLYIARFGIKSVICDDIWRNELSSGIEEDLIWPGLEDGTYQNRCDSIKNQSEQFGALLIDQRVSKIDLSEWPFTCTLDNGMEFKCLALVLATGCTQGVPNNNLFAKQIDLDADGYIQLVDRSHKTSKKGVFAAGSIHDKIHKVAIVAASDGARAAIDVKSFLFDLGFNTDIQERMNKRFFNNI